MCSSLIAFMSQISTLNAFAGGFHLGIRPESASHYFVVGDHERIHFACSSSSTNNQQDFQFANVAPPELGLTTTRRKKKDLNLVQSPPPSVYLHV